MYFFFWLCKKSSEVLRDGRWLLAILMNEPRLLGFRCLNFNVCKLGLVR